jgi:fatty acid desaturase
MGDAGISTDSDGNAKRPRGDAFDGQLPARLPKAVIQELSRPAPAIMIAHIAVEWIAILTAIVVCEHFWHPVLYAVCVAFIAARQHALTVLMHEGVHYRIATSKWWNDIIAEVLCAWPVFLPMRGFRRHHFAHHRHMNTDDDPDYVRKKSRAWQFPKRKSELFRMLLLDATGVNFWMVIAMFAQVSVLGKPEDAAARRDQNLFQTARILFYVGAFAVLWQLDLLGELALYWIVPLFTWYAMIMHIRSIAEHFAVPRDHFYTHTRTVVPSIFDRVFLVPKNICYHIEHHFYPSVPFFRLPRLHALMMTSDPTFRVRAHVTYSYWAALKEFCGTPRATTT